MTVIAACQLALAIGDLAGNARTVASAVHDAAARGAQFVVLPDSATRATRSPGPPKPARSQHRPRTAPRSGTGDAWQKSSAS